MHKSWWRVALHASVLFREESAYISPALHYLSYAFSPVGFNFKSQPGNQDTELTRLSPKLHTFYVPISIFLKSLGWRYNCAATYAAQPAKEIAEENRAASIRPPHPARYPPWINLELTQIADANRQALNYRQNRACRRDPPVTPRPF